MSAPGAPPDRLFPALSVFYRHALGVETPKALEWTTHYHKDLALVGSHAFGFETFEGRRQHAMEWYYDQGASGAVKVLFDRFD